MPRQQCQLDAPRRERAERSIEEALGAAERRVALADDRKPHQADLGCARRAGLAQQCLELRMHVVDA